MQNIVTCAFILFAIIEEKILFCMPMVKQLEYKLLKYKCQPVQAAITKCHILGSLYTTLD